MYLKKIPAIIQRYYPDYLWRIPTGNEKVLYLTFDDGPTPEISSWVLDQLEKYGARATFFLIGKNVKAHPELVHQLLDAGHRVGNHTENHLNGWKTPLKSYLKDSLQGQKTIQEYTGKRTTLFRPPYGKITNSQAIRILRSHQIVMMDVLSGDFDESMTAQQCASAVITKAIPGSIVLFHDSVKAWDRLEEALPQVLEHFLEKGYRFEALTESSDLMPLPESSPS